MLLLGSHTPTILHTPQYCTPHNTAHPTILITYCSPELCNHGFAAIRIVAGHWDSIVSC